MGSNFAKKIMGQGRFFVVLWAIVAVCAVVFNVYAGTYDKYSGRFQCAATAWMELPAPYQEDD